LSGAFSAYITHDIYQCRKEKKELTATITAKKGKFTDAIKAQSDDLKGEMVKLKREQERQYDEFKRENKKGNMMNSKNTDSSWSRSTET